MEKIFYLYSALVPRAKEDIWVFLPLKPPGEALRSRHGGVIQQPQAHRMGEQPRLVLCQYQNMKKWCK
jgi:hypothetical protein